MHGVTMKFIQVNKYSTDRDLSVECIPVALISTHYIQNSIVKLRKNGLKQNQAFAGLTTWLITLGPRKEANSTQVSAIETAGCVCLIVTV